MGVDPVNLSLTFGGRVSNSPQWDWPERRSTERAVILVHGYNVGAVRAERDLSRFRTRLSAKSPGLGREVLTSAWAGKLWTRALAYPWTIKHAVASADTLGTAIKRWYDGWYGVAPRELVLIAHSLGCRVVMETLAKMADRPRPAGMRRLVVVLLAAAVPVPMLRPGGKLHKALSVPDTVAVLHSEYDFILNDLFPLGQTFAREGLFPAAVGLKGEPRNAACAPEDMQPLNHGDYWESDQVADKVCRVIGAQTMGSAHSAAVATRAPLRMASLPTMPPLPFGVS